ncbi:hypothetical protein LB506_012564 [Fusarium annulatum]|nr:hypothetical protein LB506_012564 [Fusarium annulatum]
MPDLVSGVWVQIDSKVAGSNADELCTYKLTSIVADVNMSVLGSQSGLSEQTLSDEDDSNVPMQILAETIDRRKTQNRIAQRKHSQSPTILSTPLCDIARSHPSMSSSAWK